MSKKGYLGLILFLVDKCITVMDPHTGNEYKYKNFKRPTDNRTYGQTYYTDTQEI